MIPGLKSGDPVTICPFLFRAPPIEAWVENRSLGTGFVTLARAADRPGVVCQLLEDEEGEIWARGHGADVAAALLLTRSAR